ncbi:MAG: chorismate lyase [Pseudomonadota bacterium]
MSKQTSAVERQQIPTDIQPWLDITGSMTQAIADATNLTPYVNITFSGVDTTSNWEQQSFPEVSCFARQIELKAGDFCCLFARSIAQTESPAALALATLGNRPLADLLFHGDWQAGEITTAKRGDDEFGRAVNWHTPDGQTIMVQEFIRLEFAQRYTPRR